MRDYSKIGPKFWIGATGKKLRAAGMEAQVVAMYLLTSPHANMLGLYYCPIMYIAHETGMTLEGASKGLQRAIEAGFCEYDEDSEVVWVIEMAGYQVGESLKPNDLRVKGVQNEYASLPGNPYLERFFEKYRDAFHMQSCRESLPENGSPSQAPSKPLRSQEQEQEKEQEQEQNKNLGRAGAPATPPGPTEPPPEPVDPPATPAAEPPEAPPAAPPPVDPPPEPPIPTPQKALGVRELIAEGVNRQHAADWLKVRKVKGAPLTETAWDAVKREAEAAAITPAEAVRIAAENSWQGFRASWLNRTKPRGDALTPAQRRAEAEHQRFLEMTREKPADGQIIDMEAS